MNEWFFAFVVALVAGGFITAALLILYLPDSCACGNFVPEPDGWAEFALEDGTDLVILPTSETRIRLLSDSEGFLVSDTGQRLQLRRDGRLLLGAATSPSASVSVSVSVMPVRLVRAKSTAGLALAAGSKFLYTLDGRVFARVSEPELLLVSASPAAGSLRL
jgi:hypothetical protein